MKHNANRRILAAGLALAPLAATGVCRSAPLKGDQIVSDDPVTELLKESLANKSGISLQLTSGTVAMVVSELDLGWVVGRSQQYDRIVVRRDRIEAAYR